MLFFVNDYGFGAHPKVLEHLTETNMQPLIGYGNDEITASAAEKIKAACACPEGQVYFLTGGTQTNMVVIDALLRPYEGVVASSCGHVNTHEAGAIESTGHKVLTVPHKNGKLDADDLVDLFATQRGEDDGLITRFFHLFDGKLTINICGNTDLGELLIADGYAY